MFVCVDPVASLCYYNAHLCFYFGTPAPVAVRSHGTHVGMAASLHHAPAPLLHLVVLVALVLLVTTLRVEVHPVHCLHVLPQRARVRVTLCAPWCLAHVRFLGEERRVNGKAFQYGCVDMGVPHRSSRELVEAQSFVFQKHIWKRSDSCGHCALIISWPTFRQRELILATGDCSFKSSDFGAACCPVIVFLLCGGTRWAQWAVRAYQQAGESAASHPVPRCRARCHPQPP